jgi:hypothetical protein
MEADQNQIETLRTAFFETGNARDTQSHNTRTIWEQGEYYEAPQSQNQQQVQQK